MIDNKSIKKYYADVSPAELKRLQDFLATHEIKHINSVNLSRICSQLVILESSMFPDRIKLFLVRAELGY